MLLRQCRRCGAPYLFQNLCGWNSSGTITTMAPKASLRVAFVEQGELHALIDGITEAIGFPIDEIVSRGEEKAQKSSVTELLSEKMLRGWLFRSKGFTRRFIGGVTSVAACLGHGKAELIEFTREKSLLMRMYDPYALPLVIGDLKGVYEAYFQTASKVTILERGETPMIRIEKAGPVDREEDPQRLQLKEVPTVPGEITLTRCRGCGTPSEMADAVTWDTAKGTIHCKSTGRRLVMIIVEAINAVIRELGGELGETVNEMVQRFEQRYIAEVYAGVGADGSPEAYKRLLSDPAAFGQCNPVEAIKERNLLTVRVDNPFCEPLLAGKVAGLYEAVEKVRAKAVWTPASAGYAVIQAWPV